MTELNSHVHELLGELLVALGNNLDEQTHREVIETYPVGLRARIAIEKLQKLFITGS